MRDAARRAKTQATLLIGLVALLWFLELVDQVLLHRALDQLGIHPRSLEGLWGILFAPFLHAGFVHLLANTVPLVVLGWLVMLRRIADFFLATAATMLIGGLGVWLLGAPNSIHLGASILIFGYLGYLLLRGFYERSPLAVAIAVVAGLLYGGALWGVLPGQPGVSWQGHLFGFIGGGAAARLLSRTPAPTPRWAG